MPARRLVVLGCALIGCSASKPATSQPASAPASEPEPILAGEPDKIDDEDPKPPLREGEFVLAGPGTDLFEDARLTKPLFRLGADSQPFALRLLKISDGVATVSTQNETHCGFSNPARWAEVKLFMAADDLMVVTRTAVDRNLPDGTFLRLSAGVPVGRGTVHVELMDGRPVDLPVELPPSALGRSYPSHESFPFPVNNAEAGEVERLHGPCIDSIRQRDKQEPARAQAGIMGVLRSDSEESIGLGGLGLIGTGRGGAMARVEVERGTAIKWPSGQLAGTVKRKTELHDEVAAPDGMRCFMPPYPSTVAATPFCFDASRRREGRHGDRNDRRRQR